VSSSPSVNDLQHFLAIVATPGVCGLDFETTIARLYKREICTIQVAHADGRESVLHLWAHPEWLGAVQSAMLASPCTFAAHFAIFECEMLTKYGMLPARLECTYVAARVLRGVVPGNGVDPDFSLAGLLMHELGMRVDKTVRARDWREPLDDAAVEYTLDDARGARDLWLLYWAELQDDFGQEMGYRIIADALPAIAECNLTGLEFDVEAHDRLCAQKAEEARVLAFELDLIAPGINPNSAKQVGDWIAGQLTYEPGASHRRAALVFASVTETAPWPTTGGGQLSLARPLLATVLPPLERVAHDAALPEEVRTPWADAYRYLRKRLDYQKAAKILQAFGPSLRTQVDEDGCIRTTLKPHGARTSRQSSVLPNLQNQPKEAEFRRMYKRRRRRKVVQADYNQIELRVGAIEAPDLAMQKVFRDGLDIHTATACSIHAIPLTEFGTDPVHKTWRSNGKPVTFASLYGAQAPTIALNSGLPFAEAADLLDRWLTVYSGIAFYRENQPRRAHEKGYVELVSGQRIRVRDDSRAAQLINAPVQGSAASVMYRALTRVHRRLRAEGLDARLALCVHDEILLDAAEECAYRAGIVLREEMAAALLDLYPQAAEMGLAKVADAVIIDNWGEKDNEGVGIEDFLEHWSEAA
jgi:DNA polymerase I-like protein with 3'-5' exonuclease and polymerase domains